MMQNRQSILFYRMMLAWYLGIPAVVLALGRRYLGETPAALATVATALDPSLMANAAVPNRDFP